MWKKKLLDFWRGTMRARRRMGAGTITCIQHQEILASRAASPSDFKSPLRT
ncbi:hypothetical protein SCH4B_0265 [Ruegeria sp. TrichCH4B]|nr:hypothetical protein SCH4B_0265 [Ruegeria sp. TrichCH4B]